MRAVLVSMNQRLKPSIIIIPFIIAILVMIPRLLSPQFGFLDDGAMLAEANQITQGDFRMMNDLQAGRFRPIYWLYFAFIYQLAGANPFWFYFGHLIILLILLFELQLLMKHFRANKWQIFVSSCVFVLSVPIIENFYTLSKGEPLQLAFILSSILISLKWDAVEKRAHRRLIFILSTLCLIAGMMVKETTIVIIPISGLWAGYAHINNRNSRKIEMKNYFLFFISSLFASIIFLFSRQLTNAPPLTEGTYTALYTSTWSSLVTNFARWMTLYIYYFHYLIPLIILGVGMMIKKTNWHHPEKQVLFNWSVWAVLWIMVFLPWDFAEAYFLLPFSSGISILIGLTSFRVYRMIKTAKRAEKCMLSLGVLISGLLFLSTLSHYRTHAYTQLIFDSANHKVLLFTIDNLPKNHAVFVNFETRIEYVDGIENLLIHQHQLSDIYYHHISATTLERVRWIPDGIVLIPLVENKPELILRAGVDNIFTKAWNTIVLRVMDDRIVSIGKIEQGFQILNFNLPVIFCPAIGEKGYCKNPDPLLDTRFFSYGWEVFQIK